MARTKFRDSWQCSFCGRGQQQVERLIAGPGAYICDGCVELCNHILADGPTPPAAHPAAAKPGLRQAVRALLRIVHPAAAR